MIGEKAAWEITLGARWWGHDEDCAYKRSDRKAVCDCTIMRDMVEADRKADAGELDVDYVFDLVGNVTKLGDRVAYAAIDGRSSALRIGKIIEIRAAHVKFDSWDKEKRHGNDVPVKLRIEVELDNQGHSMSKPVLIEAGFKRFVKLG